MSIEEITIPLDRLTLPPGTYVSWADAASRAPEGSVLQTVAQAIVEQVVAKDKKCPTKFGEKFKATYIGSDQSVWVMALSENKFALEDSTVLDATEFFSHYTPTPYTYYKSVEDGYAFVSVARQTGEYEVGSVDTSLGVVEWTPVKKEVHLGEEITQCEKEWDAYLETYFNSLKGN